MGERIKDLIYDFSDIIISLVIITMIFGVVSWKISDSMAYTQFTGQPTNAVLDKNDKDSENKDTEANGTTETVTDTQSSNTDGTSTNAGTNTNNATTQPPATTGSTTSSTTGSTTDTTAQGGKPTASAGSTTGTTQPTASTTVSSDIKIVIPPGSAGITIAKILKEQGVITDTKAFISRVDALKMGPKLKAGTFTIKAGSTMDDVIYIIAGKK